MGKEGTEAPTPKRKREARREGRVARTPDLSAWITVGAALTVVPGMIRRGSEALQQSLRDVGDAVADPTPERAMKALTDGLGVAERLLLPLLAVALVVAVASNIAQTGLVIATKAAKPSAKNLNPINGFKKNFGPKGLWEGTKVLIKVLLLGVVFASLASSLATSLPAAGLLPLSSTLAVASAAVGKLVVTAALVGMVVAGADYAVAKRRVLKELRMTVREVKDEGKQAEGDPQLKGAIRSRQLAMSRNRMMSDVATADVLLANPTHVAVALRYDAAKGAPRVVAKGSGHVAARLRAKAAEHRVPVVVDVPLARAVYAACEVGQEIPPEAYAAVARVLAFVMSLRSRGSAAGTHVVPAQRAVTARR